MLLLLFGSDAGQGVAASVAASATGARQGDDVGVVDDPVDCDRLVRVAPRLLMRSDVKARPGASHDPARLLSCGDAVLSPT